MPGSEGFKAADGREIDSLVTGPKSSDPAGLLDDECVLQAFLETLASVHYNESAMIKYSRLPESVVRAMPQVGAFLAAHPKVQFAYLFGGLAGRGRSVLSDIDIAVYLSKDTDIVEAKLHILGRLMDILRTDEINLVVLNYASLSLQGRILAGKVVMADNNPFLRHRFESLTLRKFFDFSVKESQILEGRYLRDR